MNLTHDTPLLYAIDSLTAERHFQLTPSPLLFHEGSLLDPTHCTIPNDTSQRFLPLRLQQTLTDYLPYVTKKDPTFEQEVK